MGTDFPTTATSLAPVSFVMYWLAKEVPGEENSPKKALHVKYFTLFED